MTTVIVLDGRTDSVASVAIKAHFSSVSYYVILDSNMTLLKAGEGNGLLLNEASKVPGSSDGKGPQQKEGEMVLAGCRWRSIVWSMTMTMTVCRR